MNCCVSQPVYGTNLGWFVHCQRINWNLNNAQSISFRWDFILVLLMFSNFKMALQTQLWNSTYHWLDLSVVSWTASACASPRAEPRNQWEALCLASFPNSDLFWPGWVQHRTGFLCAHTVSVTFPEDQGGPQERASAHTRAVQAAHLRVRTAQLKAPVCFLTVSALQFSWRSPGNGVQLR